jgi:hypothetical protein
MEHWVAEQMFEVKHLGHATAVGNGGGTLLVVPDPVRYRCNACGNLTRFDVTSTTRTKAFHHYTVGGELRVEEVEVLDETVEEVACRWCGTAANVVALTAAEARAATQESTS